MSTTIINQYQPSQAELDFQAKMQERLRQAMGDLMPDEVLAGIVARGIEEAFFKPRVEKGRSQGDNDIKMPSWTVEFLEKECRNQVATAITKWVVDNKTRVEELVREALDKNLAAAAVGALRRLFAPAFEDMQRQIYDIVQKVK